MRVVHTKNFGQSLAALPLEIRKKFDKQSEYLVKDLRHPSLRCKKYDETRGI